MKTEMLVYQYTTIYNNIGQWKMQMTRPENQLDLLAKET